MRRRLRVAGLGTLLVFAGLVFAVPTVVEANGRSFDPTDCNEFGMRVIEYAREPDELDYSDPQNVRYGTLPADERALFDRGYERRDEFVPISQATFQRIQEMPSLVAYRGGVYDVGVRVDECPYIEGVPVAMNPVVAFLLQLNSLVTGPLAPVIVVVGGVALAFRLGRMLEY
jgi:hypothetical protein